MIFDRLIGIDDFQAIIVSSVEHCGRVGEVIPRADDGRAFSNNKATHPLKRPGGAATARDEETRCVKFGGRFPVNADFPLSGHRGCCEAD